MRTPRPDLILNLAAVLETSSILINASMTATVDQQIGHDAEERYETLRKELESLKIEVDRLLGPAATKQDSLAQ